MWNDTVCSVRSTRSEAVGMPTAVEGQYGGIDHPTANPIGPLEFGMVKRVRPGIPQADSFFEISTTGGHYSVNLCMFV